LLRKTYDFDGVVLSDWMIFRDCDQVCKNGHQEGETPSVEHIATPWGVMNMSEVERIALAINAGVDQFGGLMHTGSIEAALKIGLISQAQIDASVEKILKKSIESGIFESPFADEIKLAEVVNSAESAQLAEETQAKAMVILKSDDDTRALLKRGVKIYLHNADTAVFKEAGFDVVSDVDSADIAIIRTSTPYQTLHPNYFFGSIQHEGNLAFEADHELFDILENIKDKTRVIIDITLDRPAVLSRIAPYAHVLIGDFGASDRALIKALTGEVPPTGKLPFELPSSMNAVSNQDSGKPADSESPLFALGFSADKK
jgi:beta-glucosidase